MPSDLSQGLGLQDLGKGKTLNPSISNDSNDPIDSKHQEASDGITTKVGGGKKLGGELKNSGGTWESIGDSKHKEASDGITKSDGNKAGDLGQNSSIKNSGSQQEKAKESVAPMKESEWDPDNIAGLLHDDVPDIQYLFDEYVQQAEIVTLEDFNSLIRTTCGNYEINEEGIAQLMDANADKAFFENSDDSGVYWIVRPIEEGLEEGMGGMRMATPPLNPFKAADTALTGGVQRPSRGSIGSHGPRRGENLAGDVDQYADGFDLEDPESGDGGIGGDLGNMGSDLGMDDGLDVGEQVASGLGTAAGATGGPVGAGVGGPVGRVAGRAVGDMVGKGMRRRPGRIGESKVTVETHEFGMTGGDDSADEVARSLPADATSDGMDEVGKTPKMPDAIESKHEEPDDGITDEMGGLGRELGQNSKIKNKMAGGTDSMKENIESMTKRAKASINEAAKTFGTPGKYSLQFRVESETAGQARTSGKLVESLLDMEELTTAFGKNSAKMYVLFVDSRNRVAHKAAIDVGNIRSRGPIVAENAAIFRSPKVAKVFAEQVARNGVKCVVDGHNWGSKVTGRFNWNVANAAYRNIPSRIGK